MRARAQGGLTCGVNQPTIRAWLKVNCMRVCSWTGSSRCGLDASYSQRARHARSCPSSAGVPRGGRGIRRSDSRSTSAFRSFATRRATSASSAISASMVLACSRLCVPSQASYSFQSASSPTAGCLRASRKASRASVTALDCGRLPGSTASRSRPTHSTQSGPEPTSAPTASSSMCSPLSSSLKPHRFSSFR